MDIPLNSLLSKNCMDKGMGFIKYSHYGDLVGITEEQLKAQVPARYLSATNCLAMDCEMVGVGVRCDSALARVSIVNEYGFCIYDKFVKPVEKVTDYRTAKSGVHEKDLEQRGQPRSVVLKEVKGILTGRKLIGHSVHNDLEVLDYEHPREKTRDTADFFKSLSKQSNSLKALVKQYLKTDIQGGEHSSIQDAQATMKLYLLHRDAWEKDLKTRNLQARSPDDIKTITCYPRKRDLFMNSDEVFLRKNKVGVGFHSASEYLDIQFRLLREDFMRPLRLGMKECRGKITDKKKMSCPQTTVRVFTNVTVRKSKHNGELKGYSLLHIPVEENKLNLIDWEESKCLMNGSLVILTPDNFQSVKVATVNRIEDEPSQTILKQGLLNVIFIPDGPTWKLSPGMTFKMVESVAFFEAYTHTLQCLQLMGNLGSFPLAKYIVDGVTVSRIIKYPASSQNIDFSKTFKQDSKATRSTTKLANINQVSTWPPASQFGFNESQYQAFKAALTQELAIIQGPPGTGKTFLGVQLMKVFLSNPHLLDAPILVVAQTNHALDNILEPVLEFARKITGNESRGNNLMLRVGGGSKSEEVSKVTIRAKLDAVSVKKSVEKALQHADGAMLASKCFVERQFDFNRKSQTEIANGLEKIKNFLMTSDFMYADKVRLLMRQEVLISEIDAALVALGRPVKKRSPLKKKRLSGHHKGMLELALEKLMGVKPPPPAGVSFPSKTKTPIDTIEAKKQLLNSLQVSIKKAIPELLQRSNLLKSKWKALADVHPEFMKLFKVIGMTATGAAKHKDKIIHKYWPQIMIVEEAAHVLESHVVAALTDECKHLILIGDHQQLRPSTADYHLTQNYGMDVSLMERLVENGKAQGKKNWVQLNVQHRMRPEIAQLVCPVIYNDLHNHESVTKFPDVKGVEKNMFFLDHRQQDKRESESPSHFNEHEAALTAKLCQYFIGQGYKGAKISIITTYVGQKHLLERKLRGDSSCKDVRICCVDGFQGEENDIIILSLVRSNPSNVIGFLSTDNRVCVALSRARHGFFILGNMEGLAAKSKTWAQINKTLIRSGAIGPHLTLKCSKHGKTAEVSTASDFSKLQACGCPRSSLAASKLTQKQTAVVATVNNKQGAKAAKKVSSTIELEQEMAKLNLGKKNKGNKPQEKLKAKTNGQNLSAKKSTLTLKPKKTSPPSNVIVPASPFPVVPVPNNVPLFVPNGWWCPPSLRKRMTGVPIPVPVTGRLF